MRYALLAPAFAGAVKEGPLSPCAPSQTESGTPADPPAYAWGVEIASSFSKDNALADFDRVKQDYAGLLGSYEPMVVETCDLHLGTDLRYWRGSAWIAAARLTACAPTFRPRAALASCRRTDARSMYRGLRLF